MKPQTRKILAMLREVEWFSHVGQPIADKPELIVLKSWDEAFAHFRSPEWKRTQIFTRDVYFQELMLCAPHRAMKWNESLENLRPFVHGFVREMLALPIQEYQLPNDLIESVNWDIENLIIEEENFDLHAGGFYLRYAGSVYAAGHFPCGWIGEPPRGRPIVY